MRHFIELSYDGTAYHGWQVQPNGESVQGVLQRALSLLLRAETPVTGAGRTDAGVHAAKMVAHFDTDAPLPTPPVQEGREQTACDYLVYRLNGMLPSDIAIHRIFPVADEVHARFSAVARTYYYYVHTRKSPFLRDHSWRLVHVPDFEAMNRAADLLMEYTDFTSFSKLHTDSKTNICHVRSARWVQLADNEWRFEITADRFLRNMVRAIVGTLMEVGRGQLTLDGFRQVIEQKNRSVAGDSVPARGLFLQDVEYEALAFALPVREGRSLTPNPSPNEEGSINP
ncbi:MAG: tRNA pseudouridine(38-40) synthase TruA [Bacteroidaceae bacterium]|nr:tRNA pseudouridine(38-40) synthase TruA [Bacteroidaceae bacterium]